ncbi:MAG TPA: response regulator [Tepidisphaeraceae bacterium]|nr:response regulator [Tepidisphaeraceae bacterium]
MMVRPNRMRQLPPKLLVLDNDEAVLSQAARVFGGYFVVLQVRNPARAMGLLEGDKNIRAILTEQVMRSADGVDLLESIRTMRPDVRRVLLTTYTDLATIVSGLHSGAVQCLVQKPASDAELIAAVCPELAQRAAAYARRASA